MTEETRPQTAGGPLAHVQAALVDAQLARGAVLDERPEAAADSLTRCIATLRAFVERWPAWRP